VTKKEDPRVRKIQQLKDKGYTNIDIARLLGISESRIRQLLKEAKR
jgi:DNA-binding CsgD family transcriptional regulator